MSLLLQVIIGSERSRIRATLPFYFTRRFLDAPLTQRQRTASEQWRSGGAAAGGDARIAAVGDVEAGLGTQHGSTASIASTDGGDVPLQGTRLQQGDWGFRLIVAAIDCCCDTHEKLMYADCCQRSVLYSTQGSLGTGATASPQQGDSCPPVGDCSMSKM